MIENLNLNHHKMKERIANDEENKIYSLYHENNQRRGRLTSKIIKQYKTLHDDYRINQL